MRKTKVIEIISDLHHRGGAETFCLTLCRRLAQDPEIDFYLISLYNNPSPLFETDLSKWEGRVFFCGKHKGFDPLAAMRLRRIVKKIGPDIIHGHLWVMNTIRLAFGTRPKGFSIVQTLHSVPAIDTRKMDCRAKRKLTKSGSLTLVGIAPEISEAAKEQYSTDRVRTITNGIEFPPLAEREKEFDFVCVANFSKVKNHQLLLTCMAHLVETYPKARLVCCGSGELLEPMKKLAESLGITQNVKFTGYVLHPQEYLSSSHCFVLASSQEGNPLSILEAMHAGLPIIAPHVGGIPDVVSSEVGILFETGNRAELVEAMKRSIAERKAFAEMGKRGEKASESFEFSNCYQAYKHLFLELRNN